MTKDEIKKALLYCQDYGCDSCIDCPYYARSEECTNDILKDALNIITEQEKEIELLKMQIKDVVNHADTFLAEEQKFEAENVKLKAEIEQLKTALGQCNTELNSALENLKSQCREIGELKAKVKQAQIDILNKAKEKFNAISRELGDDCDLCGVSAVCSCRCEINNLIKEIEK